MAGRVPPNAAGHPTRPVTAPTNAAAAAQKRGSPSSAPNGTLKAGSQVGAMASMPTNVYMITYFSLT